jgi:glutamine---fructose-6-phosphate transaminase (isomerizing)
VSRDLRLQVTVLALLTAWFRQLREEEAGKEKLPVKEQLLEALARLPISFGMARRTRDQCKLVAERLREKEHLFLLGKVGGLHGRKI